MEYLGLNEIEQIVNGLARLIDPPGQCLPTFGYTKDYGFPHVEVDDRGYHFVIVERGQERERKTTRDIDEILYWVFESATFSMASEYELANRVPNQDSRVLLFAHQMNLMKAVSLRFCQEIG